MDISPEDQELLDYACAAYGFLLDVPLVRTPVTSAQFADLIAETYDAAEEHNAAVIAVLRRHDLIMTVTPGYWRVV